MTPISNAEKRERLNRLSEEEWMRWAYVPFCVAAGIWDYADSVINVAAQMRLSETKKLCQAIRELKRKYDGVRRRHAMTSSGYELDNFMTIEKISKNSLRYMYACIKDSIQRQYPELSDEYQTLLTGVYACLTMLDILYKYMKIQEKHVCDICGFQSISCILPSELSTLRKLMPLFAGDKPIKVKGIGIFVHNIVNKLCKTELVDSKEDAGIE